MFDDTYVEPIEKCLEFISNLEGVKIYLVKPCDLNTDGRYGEGGDILYAKLVCDEERLLDRTYISICKGFFASIFNKFKLKEEDL